MFFTFFTIWIIRRKETAYSIDFLYTTIQVLEEPDLFQGVQGRDAVQERLKDGVILCQLMNAIEPDSILRVNKRKQAFCMMENINSFLEACKKYGVQSQDLFQTVDLYEKENMGSVINGIYALSRKAQLRGYTGPALGPRESQTNIRSFTDEQLNEGKHIIGGQYGSNKGANQQGLRFGKQRGILME